MESATLPTLGIAPKAGVGSSNLPEGTTTLRHPSRHNSLGPRSRTPRVPGSALDAGNDREPQRERRFAQALQRDRHDVSL